MKLTAAAFVMTLLAFGATPSPATGKLKNDIAPALIGQTWIGSEDAIKRAKELRGHVTIVHFWTFGCINCKHNLPHYNKWAKLYDPNQVSIVGIHTPELAEERNEQNVRREIKRQGITYPVLVDTNGTNWDRYRQQVWPSVYVVDQRGHVRGKWEGELQWDGRDGESEVRQLVNRLLREG